MFVLLLLINAFKASGAPTTTGAHSLNDPLNIRSLFLPGCHDPAYYRPLPDIIRTCTTLMLSCAWSFIHLNVPHPEQSPWKTLWHKTFIFIVAFVFPELIAFWALRQFLGAIKHAREYNKKFNLKCPSVLSLYWYMGSSKMSEGEAIDNSGQNEGNGEGATCLTTKSAAKIPWTLRHGFLLEMGGLVLWKGDNASIVHRVSQLPVPYDLPEAHIIDRSKRPTITRAIFVFQIIWFWLQCGARIGLRLRVTQLEWLTLGVVVFNLAAQIFWFFKPQNMNLAFELRVAPNVECDPQTDLHGLQVAVGVDEVVVSPWFLIVDQLGADNRTSTRPRLHLFYCLPWRDLEWSLEKSRDKSSVPPDIERPSGFCLRGTKFRLRLLTSAIAGCSSGSLLLASCFVSAFPSPWERGIWTAAVIWMLVGQALFYHIKTLADIWPNLARFLIRFLFHLVGPGVFLYCVARLLLVIVAFSSFRCTPVDIYLNLSFADWKASFTEFQFSKLFRQSDFRCY